VGVTKAKKGSSKELLSKFIKTKYYLVYQGALIGLFGGSIVTLYRFLLSKVSDLTYPMYSTLVNNPIKIIFTFIILALCGYIVGLMIKIEPMITGSGIPQVQGILIGKMRIKWLRVVLLKFIGGIISIGAGLSLGREGPSVQIGAASGIGVSRMTKGNKTQEKFCVVFGSSAGLSAAFNAPMAGVLFAFEELQKSFSVPVLLGCMSASTISNFISSAFFGLEPIFNFKIKKQIPMTQYPYLLLLGVALGIMGFLFNKFILLAVNRYDKYFKFPVEFKPIIPFLFTGIMGLNLPILLGGGSQIITEFAYNEYTIIFIASLLVLKFIFTIVSYSSSSPGGIFLPLLSIGATIGCLMARIFVDCFGMDTDYIKIFITLGMAGYFSSVVKSPVTGIILITEMTGGVGNLFSISFVCVISYLVAILLKSEPVYEMLLKNTLSKKNRLEENREKTVMEVPIKINSKVIRKKIKDLNLPPGMIIVAIKRHGDEIIPTPETRLDVGDELIIFTQENLAYEILVYFE